MTATTMRPSSFRHDKRGSQVVEIRREEYERSKQAILEKIRRRLVILGVVVGLLSVAALVLGGIIRGYFMDKTHFQRKDAAGVQLYDLYFVYGGEAAVFSLHGFYMDGKWRTLLADGYHLVMHVRVYSVLGAGSCALVSTLSSFGLVELQYIAESGQNLIYLTTLVLVCIHLVVSPWLLRTIHRKGSQADEYFGAEFVHSINRARRRDRYRDAGGATRDADGESEHNEDDRHIDSDYSDPARATPPQRSPRPTSPRSQRQKLYPDEPFPPSQENRNRKAFYDAQGNALVAPSNGLRHDVSLAVDATEYYYPPPRQQRAADAGAAVTGQSPGPSIPYASPVFVLDPHARLDGPEFWRLWKQTETTGAFSCVFTNHPTRAEVEAHLQANGFRVLSAEQQDGALQVYFYASQLGGGDRPFLCEFVLLSARRFFQATFKCKEREAASDFVTRFNLQALLAVDGE